MSKVLIIKLGALGDVIMATPAIKQIQRHHHADEIWLLTSTPFFILFKNWEGLAEGRMLVLPNLMERRGGALVALYRYLGDHFKVGVGYNFTDFSDDLTDLSYDHHGVFFNLIGTL